MEKEEEEGGEVRGKCRSKFFSMSSSNRLFWLRYLICNDYYWLKILVTSLLEKNNNVVVLSFFFSLFRLARMKNILVLRVILIGH